MLRMGRSRMIRMNGGSVKTVPERAARSLVSRRLAEYVTEFPADADTVVEVVPVAVPNFVPDDETPTVDPAPTPRRRGRPKGSKNKPKQDSDLPGSTPQGDVADIAGDMPLNIE